MERATTPECWALKFKARKIEEGKERMSCHRVDPAAEPHVLSSALASETIKKTQILDSEQRPEQIGRKWRNRLHRVMAKSIQI